jgi:hypothetical protein
MLLSLGGIPYEDEAVWGTAFQYYKQHELYPFGKTPVMVVSPTTATIARNTTTTATTPTTMTAASDNDNNVASAMPPTRTPTLVAADAGIVVAQSGSLARYAAKLAGRYLTGDDHTACAVSDAIFELGQELCTTNPLGRAEVYGANFEILAVRRTFRRQRHLLDFFVSELCVESVFAFWNSHEP